MPTTKRPSRREWVLAALSPAQCGDFQPVQVQKLFFLLDERVVVPDGGKRYFDFAPYDYGPFDRQVYDALEVLEAQGLVTIRRGSGRGGRSYNLTERGQTKGAAILASLDPEWQKSVSKLAKWVKSTSFTELVSAVYDAYPEMRANSVFQS